MNVYEIVVFVSWLAALWAIITASIQQSSAFESIGHAKWKWVLINALGFIVPYLGLVTAGIYAFRVYRHLPTRSSKIKQLFSPARSQSTMDQSPDGYHRQPNFPAPQNGFTANASKPAEASRIPCGACGGTGRVNKDQACYPCGGNGYV
ncbi:MAG TPA: hypothetical protein VG142_08840 [Trebonia sp.]|jgi:hypothetical protein|nr:hypothetical protein [Trebonia sp.]